MVFIVGANTNSANNSCNEANEQSTTSPPEDAGVMKMSPFKRPRLDTDIIGEENVFKVPLSPAYTELSPSKELKPSLLMPSVAGATSPLRELNVTHTPPPSTGQVTPTREDRTMDVMDSALETSISQLLDTPTPAASECGERKQEAVDMMETATTAETSNSVEVKHRIKCQCGAKNCRGWLY